MAARLEHCDVVRAPDREVALQHHVAHRLIRACDLVVERGILAGQYPPDTRIPTESELVETYEVARSTARRAVAALREEGLVYTVQARGTYVARLNGETR